MRKQGTQRIWCVIVGLAVTTVAHASMIDFEAPEYALGGLNPPWVVESSGGILQVVGTGAYAGDQCLAAEWTTSGGAGIRGTASYPVAIDAGNPLTLRAQVGIPDYHPGNRDPGFVSHGLIGLRNQYGNYDARVLFDMNKPYNTEIDPVYRRILVAGSGSSSVHVGYFLPGAYHDVEMTWNWDASTVDVTITRPDAIEYSISVPLSGGALTDIICQGSDLTGLPTRFDNIELVPEPATLALVGLGAVAALRRRRA